MEQIEEHLVVLIAVVAVLLGIPVHLQEYRPIHWRQLLVLVLPLVVAVRLERADADDRCWRLFWQHQCRCWCHLYLREGLCVQLQPRFQNQARQHKGAMRA